MNLNKYLTEVTLDGDEELNGFFDNTLKQIFSSAYYNKIENTLDKIKLSYYNNPKDRAAAYIKEGNNKIIYINRYFFDKFNREKKMEFLVHEFFHILQQTKSFIFEKKFKEIIELDSKISNAVLPYLNGSITSFLTGQVNHVVSKPDYEMLSYIIGNRSADWSKIGPKGKKIVQELIETSGIFNTSTDYWKKVF